MAKSVSCIVQNTVCFRRNTNRPNTIQNSLSMHKDRTASHLACSGAQGDAILNKKYPPVNSAAKSTAQQGQENAFVRGFATLHCRPPLPITYSMNYIRIPYTRKWSSATIPFVTPLFISLALAGSGPVPDSANPPIQRSATHTRR